MMGSHLVDGGMGTGDFMRKRSSDHDDAAFFADKKANAFEETDNTSMDASSLQSTNSLFSGDQNEAHASKRAGQGQSRTEPQMIDPELLL